MYSSTKSDLHPIDVQNSDFMDPSDGDCDEEEFGDDDCLCNTERRRGRRRLTTSMLTLLLCMVVVAVAMSVTAVVIWSSSMEEPTSSQPPGASTAVDNDNTAEHSHQQQQQQQTLDENTTIDKVNNDSTTEHSQQQQQQQQTLDTSTINNGNNDDTGGNNTQQQQQQTQDTSTIVNNGDNDNTGGNNTQHQTLDTSNTINNGNSNITDGNMPQQQQQTLDDSSSNSCSSFECLTDRRGHFQWIKLGQALCNDQQRFGLTRSGQLIQSTLINVDDRCDSSTSATSSLVVLHEDPLAEAFQMTDKGHFVLVKGLDSGSGGGDATNDNSTVVIIWEAVPNIDINPTPGFCLRNPQLQCPYLHLRKSGDLVLNSINTIDGSWSDRKVHKLFPDLFP